MHRRRIVERVLILLGMLLPSFVVLSVAVLLYYSVYFSVARPVTKFSSLNISFRSVVEIDSYSRT